MPENFGQVVGLVMVPVVVAVFAAALSMRRNPGPKLMSGVQHFAAGVVLAAVAGEVLPALRKQGHLWWAVGGFALGTVLVIVLEFIGEREEKAEALSDADSAPADASRIHSAAGKAAAAALPIGMLIPVAVDLLMDGMLVGLGAALGFTQALILTVALTIEVVFLGISLSASLRQSGQSVGRSLAWTSGVALMMLVGAIGGVVLLGGTSPQVLAAALAFGAAALLDLAVEELMTEAHENAETPWLAALFFVGFLAIYILGAVAG